MPAAASGSTPSSFWNHTVNAKDGSATITIAGAFSL